MKIKKAMKKKKLFTVFVSVILLACSQVTPQSSEPIPMNPRVKYGKLSNGMTYYIMHNEEPKRKG